MTGAPLSPERWARVQALFLDALDRAGPEREAFLQDACGGDALLRAEVESLVAAHQRGGPIREPVPPEPAPVGPPGSLRWVGPYRLLVELGQGGMGSVYLAEREGEGFTQRVALKLMRPDYADSRVAAHLEAERRILARLEHPGIARFIDGGTTPSRQPYIAMEYVDGTPLLEYCARQGLDVRQRVALFAEVCDAVQHAHGQLVVHRDLKPANVMVTRDGAPKLLDFGVATVLSDASYDPARQTANWLTPAYASPEQLRREPVTVLTDVYALGLILYELVTGERPYDLGDGSWETILRTVTEATPAPPSHRKERGEWGLPRALAADLDVIVLKALAKEPQRRYRSAEQLGDDLRRWLRGDPVRAQPDTIGYRAGKFVRRHRTLVALAAVAVMSLVGGIAATAWQARVAGRERDTARAALRRSEDVTRFLLGLFEASDPRGGVDTLTGRALLQTGLARVDELSDQPLVQAAMLDALGQVLVGRGRPADALRLHEQGAALRAKALGEGHPELAVSHRFAAVALRNLARYPEAEARLREALRLEVAAYGEGALETTETLVELGFLLPYLGRMEASESLYRQAYTIRAAVLGDTSLATLRTHLVLGLRMRNRDPEGSEATLRRVVALADGPGEEAALLRSQAMIHLGDVVMLRRGDRTEAEQLFRDALAIQRGRLGDRSLTLIHGLGSLADVRAAQGDFVEAAALLEERIAINRALLGEGHPSTIMSTVTMATLLEQQGRYADAESLREEGLERVRRAVGEEHSLVAGALADIANDAGLRGDYAKAERLMREAIAMRTRLHGPAHHLVYRYRAHRAMYLSRLGRQAEAEHEVAAALAALEAELAPEHEHVRFAREAQAEVQRRNR